MALLGPQVDSDRRDLSARRAPSSTRRWPRVARCVIRLSLVKRHPSPTLVLVEDTLVLVEDILERDDITMTEAGVDGRVVTKSST